MHLFPAKIITFPPPDFTHLHVSAQSITCSVDSNESPGRGSTRSWQPRGPGDDAVVETEGTLCLPEDGIQMGGELFLASAQVLLEMCQAAATESRGNNVPWRRGLFGSSRAAATRLALDRSFIVRCFTCTDFTVPVGPLQVPFIGVERIYFGIHVIVQTT